MRDNEWLGESHEQRTPCLLIPTTQCSTCSDSWYLVDTKTFPFHFQTVPPPAPTTRSSQHEPTETAHSVCWGSYQLWESSLPVEQASFQYLKSVPRAVLFLCWSKQQWITVGRHPASSNAKEIYNSCKKSNLLFNLEKTPASFLRHWTSVFHSGSHRKESSFFFIFFFSLS